MVWWWLAKNNSKCNKKKKNSHESATNDYVTKARSGKLEVLWSNFSWKFNIFLFPKVKGIIQMGSSRESWNEINMKFLFRRRQFFTEWNWLEFCFITYRKHKTFTTMATDLLQANEKKILLFSPLHRINNITTLEIFFFYFNLFYFI